MSQTLRLEPLARIEGHGAITVELEGDAVAEARFEVLEGSRMIAGLARGRLYSEIPQIVSRICAICCAAHSLTALKAIEQAFNVEVDPRTRLLRELLMRGGNIASHALHLFFLAVPDLLGQASALTLAPVKPQAVELALRLKRLGNDIQEVIGGRAVHPVNLLPGGFGRLIDGGDLRRLRERIAQGAGDCDAALALIASLPRPQPAPIDATFAALRMGEEYSYLQDDEIVLQGPGVRRTLSASDFHRLLDARSSACGVERTMADWAGRPIMVGALARLAVNSDRLPAVAARAAERVGLRLPPRDPLDNNLAQAVELAIDVERAQLLVEELAGLLGSAAPQRPVQAASATATAVTEAPRGLLIHRYSFDDRGRAVRAEVVTPTALNVPSIDRHFRQAIAARAGQATAELKPLLEQIARAYDPCLSCAVEVKRRPHGH